MSDPAPAFPRIEPSHLARLASISIACAEGTGDCGSESPLAILSTCRTQRIRRVRLAQPLLAVIIEGEKELHLDGRSEHFTSGEMLAGPATLVCDVVNTPSERTGLYRALLVPFPRAVVDRFNQAFPELCARVDRSAQLRVSAHPDLTLALHQLTECLAATLAPSSAQVELRTFGVLLALVERCGCQVPLLPASASPIDRLRVLLDVAPAHPWSLGEAAGRLGLSEATLRRRLAAAGQRFRGMLEEARMCRSLSLLQTTPLSVSEVSAACGYESPSRFAARFRRRFGLPPSRFR